MDPKGFKILQINLLFFIISRLSEPRQRQRGGIVHHPLERPPSSPLDAELVKAMAGN